MNLEFFSFNVFNQTFPLPPPPQSKTGVTLNHKGSFLENSEMDNCWQSLFMLVFQYRFESRIVLSFIQLL